VSIFAIYKISTYSLSILLSLCKMGWHKKKKILTEEELIQEIKIVIQSLYDIPSMSDKLPNYIYNRIESIIEYVKEKGW
jgi:hypothetical protein